MKGVGQWFIEAVFRLMCRFVVGLIVAFVLFVLLAFPTPFSRISVVGDQDPETPPVAPEAVAAAVGLPGR